MYGLTPNHMLDDFSTDEAFDRISEKNRDGKQEPGHSHKIVAPAVVVQ